VLASAEKAKALNTTPMARIMGMARFECPPADFVEAPVHAAKELTDALAEAGQPTDFPIIEANESFGLQLVLFHETWPKSAINVHGGTVALKHPLGAAGARILTTLLYAMKRYNHPRGMAVICFGGGGAFATALELGTGIRGMS
jgi:acetyl-CoA C-acetyltransferase